MMGCNRLAAQNGPDKAGQLTLSDFEKITGDRTRTVLAYFHASWCVVCARTQPLVQRLDSVYRNRMEILQVDTDRDKEVADFYEIDALPVFMLFTGGQLLWIHVGIMSERDIRLELDCYLPAAETKAR